MRRLLKKTPPIGLTGSQYLVKSSSNRLNAVSLIEHTLTDFYHIAALSIVSAEKGKIMKANEITVKEKLSDGTYIEDTTGYCPAFTVGVETACRMIQEIWDKGHAADQEAAS